MLIWQSDSFFLFAYGHSGFWSAKEYVCIVNCAHIHLHELSNSSSGRCMNKTAAMAPSHFGEVTLSYLCCRINVYKNTPNGKWAIQLKSPWSHKISISGYHCSTQAYQRWGEYWKQRRTWIAEIPTLCISCKSMQETQTRIIGWETERIHPEFEEAA